jgi:hypothetical protein
MSHFSEFTIASIKDSESLVEALKILGFTNVEVHDTPQQLHGYRGDLRDQKAHVIIRKQYVGSASNDIGFLKMPDGTYKVWISDYDKSKYNDKWLTKLKSAYAINKLVKEAKRKGYQVTHSIEKEKTRVVLQRW